MPDKPNSQDVSESLKSKISNHFAFLIAFLKQIGLIDFCFQTVINTFLITIGIIAPVFWFTLLLYRTGFVLFEPKLKYLVLLSLGCVPIGALLVWLGIRNGGKRFLPLMLYLFIYGLILPVLLNAATIIIVGILFYYILDKQTIVVITIGLVFVLTLISIIYGIYSIINDGAMEESVSGSQPLYNSDSLEIITAIDDLSENSSDSSDSGSDGGGDGGD